MLSKGMRTKLALLLAFARRPELLILDEPSEGLDPVGIEHLLQVLVARSADGVSVFFSSHQIAEVERVADHVCILEKGCLLSRARLLGVRVGMGILEAIVLGVLPWIAVFFVSSMANKPILVGQVASYVLLLVGGGLVYFAMAILVSSSVAGEYTAPALAFGVVLLSAIIFDAWLRPFNVWRLATGDFSIDRSTYLLSEHLPWFGILASLSVGVLFLVVSAIVVQRREF
jgi:energy-coupling factor transporter ATP-binding protein EcfA2